jgi:DNA-3-methyladenine glycosylase II
MSSFYFKYGEKEKQWLKSRDKKLGAVIDEIGHINREVNPDLFSALVNSIVGQQISTKAQKTIWGRIQEQFSPITPENINSAPIEDLQGCGISMRKAEYIKGIAESIYKGSFNLEDLYSLSDDEVCKRLCQFKGIGKWTSEMLMIFSMQRPDILSWDDLAIQRGLRMLYGHRKITPELFAKYKRRYSPHASVASLYLWAIAGGACTELKDKMQPLKNKEQKVVM